MKIAIIGAATGQLPLCVKAKELGIETVCFAWEDGAVCKDYVDKFYPISVTNKDEIVKVCLSEKVNGVISNASDLLAEVSAYVSESLGLNGNSYQSILNIRNKKYVREISRSIKDLEPIKCFAINDNIEYPCVVKPITGAAKKGVSYVSNKAELEDAIKYTNSSEGDIIIEQYIEGLEISVETISYKKQHYVLQITDKDSSGAPHFVELGHHQPSIIKDEIKQKLHAIIPILLDKLNYENGASHIEFKIDRNDCIYLIEVNPRGGGDEISAKLVELSTGYDYIRGMLNVALDSFEKPLIADNKYSGIYYLCEQTKCLLPAFQEQKQPWVVEKKILDYKLNLASGNYDRNGFLIYQSCFPKPLNK